ncbi:MAG: GNAT family N-acetyltransferase [Bacteroidales bacterium]|nr:GNAT family N-acetyltransferase [Bacteroidales bacterium]
MEKIIDPVDINLVKAELTPDKKLRDTNKGGNEIYIVDYKDSPNTMREIGRLREITFRDAGGGTGKALDIDEFDTMEKPCKQLIVWDPDAEAILGGYRFILGPDIQLMENGQPRLATSHLFKFSDKFINDYLPHVIELGRSFVTPEYQSSKAGAKALFALDNLWDGLTILMVLHPQMTYFFGKVTMYPAFNRCGRDLILHFFAKHFPDNEALAIPYNPLKIDHDPRMMDLILKADDFKTDYKLLKEAIHSLGTSIPPLVNAYMNTSPEIKFFGTAINDEFGDVEETGILVDFDEMYLEKKARHVESYIKQKVGWIKQRFPHFGDKHAEKIASRWEVKRKEIQEKVKDKINRKK